MDDFRSGNVEYSVPLKTLIEEFKLETLYIPEGRKIKITQPEVNRPGLALSGFFEFFDHNRVQLFGNAEHQYIASLSKKERLYRLEQFAVHHPPVIILTTSLSVFDEIWFVVKKYGIALLRTKDTTSVFQAALIASLNIHLAPRITRHGVFVEVYGEGVLILGESGVGKSETAIELVKRGHRLIADDAVEIKKVSSKTLVGTAPEIIRYFVELRGIGIVDVRRLFGMGSVKESEKIDLIINLESWQDGKMYDRLGLDEQTTDILGINVPSIVLPVCPGRNLSVVIEVAAMNNRQKKMGYNTAEEFNKRLMQSMGLE